jgi:hypothetical protein
MSEGLLSQAWEMLAIAPTAQNRRLIAAAMTEDFAELGRVAMDATTARNWYRIREDQVAQTRRRSSNRRPAFRSMAGHSASTTRSLLRRQAGRAMGLGVTLMPRKRPPFVELWRDRHGKVRVYFRKDRGPRIPLPDTIGSDEFNATYQAALLGQAAPVRDRFFRAAPGTIAALIVSYMKSAEYIGLRETSKAGYINRLEALRTEHGHRTVAGLSRERITAGILQPYADRPGAALDTLKKLRILIRRAINIGWLKHDPSFGIKRPKIQRIRSWTEDEIATYRRKWPLNTRQRLAFELFLNPASTVRM